MDEKPYFETEIKRNHNPLQISGQDEILRSYTLGGPTSHRDVKMLLHQDQLEYLLKIAKHSKSRRVELPCAGIELKVRRKRSGHIYETLHLVSMPPVPEVVPTELKMEMTQLDLARYLHNLDKLK